MTDPRPDAANDLTDEQHDTASDNEKTTAEFGPLTLREERLVKLALAIGSGSEEAVRSHARRGRAEGIDLAALSEVALLAIGPLGLQRAVAAKTWVEDR